MKYKEQATLVAELRALADFYEQPRSIALPAPNIHLTEYVSVYAWIEETEDVGRHYGMHQEKTKKQLAKYVRALGSCEKVWEDNALVVTKSFGRHIKLYYRTMRENICRKVPTGEVVVHPSLYISERTEEVFEYICDEPSLLA